MRIRSEGLCLKIWPAQALWCEGLFVRTQESLRRKDTHGYWIKPEAVTNARRPQASRGGQQRVFLEAVGTLRQRAIVGHGARGLQCGRECLVLRVPRRGAKQSLPLGRGQPGRDLRSLPVVGAWRGAVERPGSHLERTRLRPHARRRQSRRRRQGVLLLLG